ncbi:hypothetical protein [uncultured Chryseobacterium sp.]|uniref:hypothetical protein n=1 Tax=uncultured Chryseobacterium sp. TaxID=259322 RepID=UPI0025D34BAB|nr:hypothetical protein [uncultured Chryseobacterium sp.]
MKTPGILVLSALLFFISCSEKKIHPYAFYYWKTKLSLDVDEKKALERSTTPYLYTRFFDVDKSAGRFRPVAMLTKDPSFNTGKKIVPVVFITNRTFFQIQHQDIARLAKSVNDLIGKKALQFRLPVHPEIQIDCDWTEGTREDYFLFLKELRKISRKEITCTLRLHQVKDKARTGIPPVSKVYLMCYSTSSPLENSKKNSILDTALLKNYLAGINEYPIRHIKIALPIYSWGIVTNHLGKHRLINAMSRKDLENTSFKRISEAEAEVLKDGFYFGHYLNKGFRIKIEEIPDGQLRDVTGFLERKIKHFDIIYYQLDRKFVTGREL